MRISSAVGGDLDYWVAVAAGFEPSIHLMVGEPTCYVRRTAYDPVVVFKPSTNWVDAGPIIDRERICFKWTELSGVWRCIATKNHGEVLIEASGETSMIAAMRAYAIAYLGDLLVVTDTLFPVGRESVVRHLIGATPRA